MSPFLFYIILGITCWKKSAMKWHNIADNRPYRIYNHPRATPAPELKSMTDDITPQFNGSEDTMEGRWAAANTKAAVAFPVHNAVL